MKNHVGFVRDHSASMRGLAGAAARDFTGTVESTKKAALEHHQDTRVSVVECGYEHTNKTRVVKRAAAVTALETMEPWQYKTDGDGTPLCDAVGNLIEAMKAAHHAGDDESFLLMITTDGEENSSVCWNWHRLTQEMRALQATDRWTFVFRVPRGQKRALVAKGVPEHNILEWDQTERGMREALLQTNTGIATYYAGRAHGMTASQSFYANTADLTSQDVDATLDDISKQVTLWPVAASEDGARIDDFVADRIGRAFQPGTAFYQLSKREKAVQDYKQIVVRDKTTNAVYGGLQARALIGIPLTGDCKLAPGDMGNFEVFVQSSSWNRKLVAGTQVLYWPNVPYL